MSGRLERARTLQETSTRIVGRRRRRVAAADDRPGSAASTGEYDMDTCFSSKVIERCPFHPMKSGVLSRMVEVVDVSSSRCSSHIEIESNRRHLPPCPRKRKRSKR